MSASAATPGQAVGHRRRARPASARRRSGCARRASRSGCPRRARMPASWPAWVGMTGQSPPSWSAASRARQVGVEGHRARHRLRRSPSARCRRGRRARSPAARSSPTSPASASSVSHRASSHAVTRDGHRVGAVGLDLDPAEGRPLAAPAAPACWPPARSSRRSASGRAGPPSGWCRRGWPRRRSRSGSARAARSRWPPRPPRRGRPGRGPARRAARRSTPTRSASTPAVSVGHRSPRPAARPARHTPSRSRSSRAAAQSRRAGGQPRAEAGQPEPRALLLGEHRHPDRPGRREAALAQRVDRRQRRDHAERAVVRPTVEHRVEVRAGQHRRGPSDAGGSPPPHHVADAVRLDLEPARLAGLDEPRPQLALRRQERLAEVAAALRRPPDRGQVAPHLLKAS